MEKAKEKRQDNIIKKEKNVHLKWVKDHKSFLVGAGISISLLVLLILGAHNKAELESLVLSIKASIAKKENASSEGGVLNLELLASKMDKGMKTGIKHTPHPVKGFARKLPAGQSASLEKLMSAHKLGIELQPGYTFVDEYWTGKNVS